MSVREEAPAKINLFLRVLRRDDDGYHDLDTLFCALELCDTVEVTTVAATGVRLHVEGAELGPERTNLAYRAAEAFLDQAAAEAGVRIRLRKRIPAGGGLGGGSSDAAATLRALDRLLPGRLGPAALHQIARRLGSDVPFFLLETPLARGRGRGDQLTPLAPLPPRHVLLVFPSFRIATADAYRWLDEARGDEAFQEPETATETLEAAFDPERHGWPGVDRIAANDFESVVLPRYPVLDEVVRLLRRGGAAMALLAGSGSSVFGLFDDPAAARAAGEAVQRDHAGWTVEHARTRSSRRSRAGKR